MAYGIMYHSLYSTINLDDISEILKTTLQNFKIYKKNMDLQWIFSKT